MSAPRRYTLVALRDLPELSLVSGDTVIVDRRHPIAPVTFEGVGLMEAEYISRLATAVFRSRPNAYKGAVPAFTVSPSYLGAQWTLEHIEWELRGHAPSPKERAEARRALTRAVRDALRVPVESAPREPHASALLGTEGFHRLARRTREG